MAADWYLFFLLSYDVCNPNQFRIRMRRNMRRVPAADISITGNKKTDGQGRHSGNVTPFRRGKYCSALCPSTNYTDMLH